MKLRETVLVPGSLLNGRRQPDVCLAGSLSMCFSPYAPCMCGINNCDGVTWLSEHKDLLTGSHVTGDFSFSTGLHSPVCRSVSLTLIPSTRDGEEPATLTSTWRGQGNHMFSHLFHMHSSTQTKTHRTQTNTLILTTQIKPHTKTLTHANIHSHKCMFVILLHQKTHPYVKLRHASVTSSRLPGYIHMDINTRVIISKHMR